ncbi:hypothetical protein ACL6C3_00090 [Capilliphycus salinus ALCB114379]|uniref:hypothetical protein n=1 Tax=Capilliphycus salinus TaxID=2768948 RepID=UPI0039A7399F
MPINILYCEGNSKSIDIRVIRQLLPKECIVRPLGGKTRSFFDSVINDRRINPNLAGIVDHDFDCRDIEPINQPLPCHHQQIQIGWAWERKEIENYLIDPIVVQRALQKQAPSSEEYQLALREAAQKISTYTAARTALSCFNFKNFWGEETKNQYFPKTYLFPRRLGKETCETKIREIVDQYKGDRIVKAEDVIDKFTNLLDLFHVNGFRFNHYLTFFSGKDLLYAMQDKLRTFGFDSSSSSPLEFFIEKIVTRMERAENVWDWLPEWQELRKLIINSSFNSEY